MAPGGGHAHDRGPDGPAGLRSADARGGDRRRAAAVRRAGAQPHDPVGRRRRLRERRISTKPPASIWRRGSRRRKMCSRDSPPSKTAAASRSSCRATSRASSSRRGGQGARYRALMLLLHPSGSAADSRKTGRGAGGRSLGRTDHEFGACFQTFRRFRKCRTQSSYQRPARRSARPIAALFNNTEAPTMGGLAIRAAVERAGIDPAEIDDVIMGCAMPQGTTSLNVGRMAALAAGLPVTVSGMTMDRQCSSGLMAIATAAKQILHDGMRVAVGGGLEQISLVQNEHLNVYRRDGPAAEGAARAHLHADAAHRRGGGEALRHIARAAGRVLAAEPAAHRGRAGGGRVRRRDHPGDGLDGDEGQGDRRDQPQGRDAGAGRGQPRRHHARGARQPEDRSSRAAASRRATPASSPTARRPAW